MRASSAFFCASCAFSWPIFAFVSKTLTLIHIYHKEPKDRIEWKPSNAFLCVLCYAVKNRFAPTQRLIRQCD